MLSLVLFLVLAMVNMPAAIALFALRVLAYLTARSLEPKRYRPTRSQREAFEGRMQEHRFAVVHTDVANR